MVMTQQGWRKNSVFWLPENTSYEMMELVSQGRLWKSYQVGHPRLVLEEALENSTQAVLMWKESRTCCPTGLFVPSVLERHLLQGLWAHRGPASCGHCLTKSLLVVTRALSKQMEEARKCPRCHGTWWASPSQQLP